MSQRFGRTFSGAVILFLVGPVVWTGHFLLVYFVAETACATTWLRSEILGMSALTFLTIGVSVLAAVPMVMLSLVAYRARRGTHGDLAFMGSLLSILSTVVILFVGIPPAFLEPC